MSLDINEELKKYSKYVPYEKLTKIIKRPVSLCAEEVTAILPSINMGADGPILVSLFLVTQNYLCEIRLMGPNENYENFDYINLKTIINYRFNVSEHIVKKADEENVCYQVANIKLLHDVSIEFSSEINYVGFDRDEWIDMVTKAIPLSLML
jgi:hypothetical protein